MTLEASIETGTRPVSANLSPLDAWKSGPSWVRGDGRPCPGWPLRLRAAAIFKLVRDRSLVPR